MTMTDAENKAKTLRTDGKGAYTMSLEQWVEIFGLQGHEIFDELQESNYGPVRFVLLL